MIILHLAGFVLIVSGVLIGSHVLITFSFILQVFGLIKGIKGYREEKFLALLSPVSLIILYVVFNFVGTFLYLEFESIFFVQGLDYARYVFESIDRVHFGVAFVFAYFALSSLSIYFHLSGVKNQKFPRNVRGPRLFRFDESGSGFSLLFALGLLFSLLLVDLGLGFLGGSGSFSIYGQYGCAIIILLNCSKYKFLIRFMIYFCLILLFARIGFHGKREVIAVVLLVAFQESLLLYANKNQNARTFLSVLIFLSFVSFGLIILMSIARGYGQFDVSSPLGGVNFVDNYFEMDGSPHYLAENFEIPGMTLYYTQAVDLALENFENLRFGVGLFRVLSLPIPRSVFEAKPVSDTLYFGKNVYPSSFYAGVSRPVMLLGVSFLNFSIIGILFVFLILYFVQKAYWRLIAKACRGEYIAAILLYSGYLQLINLFRSADWNAMVVYLVLTIAFAAIAGFPVLINRGKARLPFSVGGGTKKRKVFVG